MEELLMAGGAALCVVLAIWGFALMRSGERVAPDILPAAKQNKRQSEGTILNRIADVIGRPFTRPML